MSAPLVINLRDGSVWERRATTAAGVALYALAGSCKCPEYLMASESELAAQGIAGTADVLPVPVGPEPQAVDVVDQREQAVAWEGHVLGAWDGEFAMETGLDRAVLKLARMVKVDVSEIERLRSQVAALLAERHSTNESLDEALQELRLLNTQRGDVGQLIERERAEGEECVDIDALESALGLGSDELVEAGESS